MPANPTQPNTNSSIDRLALGIDAARGAEPANLPFPPFCFEAETSGIIPCSPMCGCFEAE